MTPALFSSRLFTIQGREPYLRNSVQSKKETTEPKKKPPNNQTNKHIKERKKKRTDERKKAGSNFNAYRPIPTDLL